jgi:adenylate cyclase
MTAAKILAVDDEPDFEALLTQRFRRQIRAEEFAFRFAHHGEEALAVLDAEPDSSCCCSTSTCRSWTA